MRVFKYVCWFLLGAAGGLLYYVLLSDRSQVSFGLRQAIAYGMSAVSISIGALFIRWLSRDNPIRTAGWWGAILVLGVSFILAGCTSFFWALNWEGPLLVTGFASMLSFIAGLFALKFGTRRRSLQRTKRNEIGAFEVHGRT